MWSYSSNAVSSIGLRKNSEELSSDEEVSSNSSREDGFECPVCCESFNIVENVPYVLWCGHTLCKNCILGLNWSVLNFFSQQIQIPFFISCPWCHLFSFRFIYKGNLKFPRKNYFLLWMVESLNGERVNSLTSSLGNHQPIPSPQRKSGFGNGSNNVDHDRPMNGESSHLSFYKTLDFFVKFTSKFPLVVIFSLVMFIAIPASAAILALYLLVTVLFAVPSLLILYFAYPTLDWLVREITSWQYLPTAWDNLRTYLLAYSSFQIKQVDDERHLYHPRDRKSVV